VIFPMPPTVICLVAYPLSNRSCAD
jgi:hypothetical protein